MTAPRPARRWAAAALTLGMLAGLGACATDTVSPGSRPNRPTSDATAPVDLETDTAVLSLDLESLPSWVDPTRVAAGEYSRPMTDAEGSFTWRLVDEAGGTVTDAADSADADPVAFGAAETYTDIPGVLTFRGNHHRTGGAYGTASVTERKFEIAWTQDIGEIRGEGSYWPGAGWTGQPLLVQWPRETKVAMGLDAEFVDDPGFVEVIYPVFEGKIYRVDLATGRQTKPPIEVGWGFKGTASVDPRGYPLLYAGQGLADTNGTHGPWRYRVFDLTTNTEIWHLPGLDPAAPRQDWGAFDSSGLVNRQTDTLIEPAENGLIYKVQLNSAFDAASGKVSIDPEVTRLRYSSPISDKYGIENSAVAYRNLMYAADNDGNLLCWDATTMQVLWMRDVEEDTDASLVLEETADGAVLYTGNEVDTRKVTTGERIANIRKIDALTGEELWQFDIPAYYTAGVNGGMLGTPVIGTGALADMVIVNVSRTTAPREGDLIALDKSTGGVIWRRHLPAYSWSSPTLITADDGAQYGVLADSEGVLHLFSPETGADVTTISLGRNTEATPAVFGNMIVVASYDAKIFGIRIS